MPVTNLPFIQLEIVRYVMTVYLVLGVVGNIFNCIMFTRQLYSRTASSIYHLSFSIFATIYLIWSIAPYMYTLNYTDLQKQSLFYCKVRYYGSHVFGQYIRFAIVLACADRFFVTRTNVRIRSFSSVSMAIKLVVIKCIVFSVIAIHILIFIDIQDGVCGLFGLYKLIYAIYQTILVGILPPLLMSIFSILTIRSLHQRHDAQVGARQRDRYLLRMVIAEVIVTISTSIPFSTNLIYGGATYYVVNKSTQRLEIESFLSFFAQVLIYLISVTPFYLFILTSKPFRNEFINILVKCWNKCILRRTRIIPLNEQKVTAPINGRMIYDKS